MQQLRAGRDRRRPAAPRRAARAALDLRLAERLAGAAEDVELELDPDRRPVAAPRQVRRARRRGCAGSRTAAAARRGSAGRRAASRCSAPRGGRGSSSGRGRGRCRRRPPSPAIPVPASAAEDRVDRLPRGVLEHQRGGHADAVLDPGRHRPAPTRVLPRRVPCWSRRRSRTSSIPRSSTTRRICAAAAYSGSPQRPWTSTKPSRSVSSIGRALPPWAAGRSSAERSCLRAGRASIRRPLGLPPRASGRGARPRSRARRVCQSSAGATVSIASGPRSSRAAASSSGSPGVGCPASWALIARSSRRRLAVTARSETPRRSTVRSWIGPMLSTAHWSWTLMSRPMPV